MGGLEIIETYWNVNCKMLQFQDSSHIEILETYWNVNVILAISLILFPSEIIETYWNVNESSSELEEV